MSLSQPARLLVLSLGARRGGFDDTKERVFELLLALSKYQTHVHPRSSYSYSEDVMELSDVRDILSRYTLVDEYPLDAHLGPDGTDHPQTAVHVDITFRAVMGDTFTSSASWFNGLEHTCMDLYDCCIVFLEVPAPASAQGREAPRLVAVPAVRSVSSMTHLKNTVTDIEAGAEDPECDPQEIRFTSPKGSPNSDWWVEWLYWIPCPGGWWIQVHSDKLKTLGVRRGTVRTDDELTKSLRSGERNISLESADMVREVVELSRTTARRAVELFQVGTGSHIKRPSQ
jgi:hypothetical protein